MWPSPPLASWRRLIRLLRSPLVLFLLLFGWLLLLMPESRIPVDVVPPQDQQSRSASGPYVDQSKRSYEDFMRKVFMETWLRPTTYNASSVHFLPSSNASRAHEGEGIVEVTDIRDQIYLINAAQKIWNEERLGPVTPDTVIFLIQVHTRRHYLQYLIESFRDVRGIEGALLIFSHDYFDPEINTLVQSIDFVRVMQMFYPYSTQLYADTFPGQDPNDCPWDMKREKAMQMRCNNAEHPDLYGHYREAKYTQIKHHWWWKIHRVFDGLRVTRNSTGLVVFVEEDHYVVPDVLHVLGIFELARKQHCSHCNIISLGTYMKSVNFASDSGRVEVCPWIASKHNMGMVLRRDNWEEIKSCVDKFCNFDDYNWDWSLQHISSNCLKNKLIVMMARAPRIFHIGECGVHHKEKNCLSDKVLAKVRQLVSSSKDHLFPSKLSLVRTSRRAMKMPKGNGGWGDLRDHWLCLHLINATVL